MPQRVQLSRRKGARHGAAINVARPGVWGNPFNIEVWGRERSISLYARMVNSTPSDNAKAGGDKESRLIEQISRDWLRRLGSPPRERIRAELRGHDLACWCPLDVPCHADVLLDIANAPGHCPPRAPKRPPPACV